MNKPVGFGLVGCGLWGSVHALTLKVSQDANLIGVCDNNFERAEEFKQQYKVAYAYDNSDVLLSNKEIEAVAIATPDFSHAGLVIAALEAGKHVIVEKPLATSVEDCLKINRLRDQKNLKLMVNYSNRWRTPFIHVKKSLESGDLGQLMMVNLKLNDTLYVPTKMLSWASKSNSLHFLGTHLIDLIRWISQSEVSRAYSVSRSVVLKNMGIDTPDFFQSILELENGASVYMENCWIVSESAPSVYEFKAEFIGSKGTMTVNISHHRMIEKFTLAGASMPDVTDQYDLDGNSMGQVSIRHFVDCVRNDKIPLVTGEDGLEAARVIEALENSASSELPVNLE